MNSKNKAHEIGKIAFDLIEVANRIWTGKSDNPEEDAKLLSEGLHSIEFKAERLAESLSR